MFAIPYEHDFTLIGTTDLDYHGDRRPGGHRRRGNRYLCELSNHYFSKPIVPADVVWTYAGVRPLVEDAAARRQGRHARLPARAATPTARRCSVFSAARSPPSASWPRKRSTCMAPVLGNRAAGLDAARLPARRRRVSAPRRRTGPCASSASSCKACSATMRGCRRRWWRAMHAPTARASMCCSTGRADVAAMGEEIAAGLYAAEVRLSAAP